ncbi:lytic transglycosylase domain-containing protein [Nocardia testacea]|uniref:lytic transglycosylase domain-containing protein n=1 Tax=Nocardia testacea TaxID=248551 RepID=UPI003A85F1DE
MCFDDRRSARTDAYVQCFTALTALVICMAALVVTLNDRGKGGTADPGAGVVVPAPGRGAPVPQLQLETVGSTRSGGDAGALAEWARQRAGRLGIPVRALQAYGYASVVLALNQPECHLGWTTLAAIARIESNHARHGGASVAADGMVSPPIRGVPLDGTGGNAVIVEADAAGRSVYSRAMGPFQFIPDTWNRWGVRAGADYPALRDAVASEAPVSDPALTGHPDNIDDAAVAAGRYLCAAGGDLSTGAGWQRAVFAYNHSTEYVDDVRRAAVAYSEEST